MRLLRQELHKGPVTLLFGAKDVHHNEAVVLEEILGTAGQASRRVRSKIGEQMV